VFRAAAETETAQGDFQDWLQLGEEAPGFQLLSMEEIAAEIFLFIYFQQKKKKLHGLSP
jgi:hypothetical protein